MQQTKIRKKLPLLVFDLSNFEREREREKEKTCLKQLMFNETTTTTKTFYSISTTFLQPSWYTSIQAILKRNKKVL